MPNDMKPGYLLKITTWENDADNYKTIEIPGLSETDCRFIISVAQLFKSSGRVVEGEFGNSDVGKESTKYRRGDADLPDALEALVATHKAKGHTVPRTYDTDRWAEDASPGHDSFRQDYTHEVLYDLIGTWNDGEYWRVYESFEVFLVPAAIENVTSQFK